MMSGLSNIENEPLHSNLNNVVKEEKVAFFEVNRTPPDVHRRRQRAAELAAQEEASFLLLTPFTSSPRVEFDKVKLGRSGVRRLVVRNPGDKALDVVFEKLPKPEKGFVIEYSSFRLGRREETSLLIGWTPVKGGAVRESFIVKFGKFSAQVVLIGSCVAPEEKQFKSTRPPRPLAPKNTNNGKVGVNNRSRPSVPASKLTGGVASKGVTIPPNPVESKTNSPPKRLIEGEVLANSNDAEVSKENRPVLQPAEFVCGNEFNNREFPDNMGSVGRRETFVRERPAPTGGDITESTPIMSSRTETFRDIRRDTIVCSQAKLDFEATAEGIMLPPTQTDIRRQTFVPSRVAAGSLRRETFLPAQFREAQAVQPAQFREAQVVQPAQVRDAQAAPPAHRSELEQSAAGRKKWVRIEEEPEVDPNVTSNTDVATPEISRVSNKPLNLSVAPLNLSRSTESDAGLNDLLAKFMNTALEEPLNLSLPQTKDDKLEESVREKEVTETTAVPNVPHLGTPKPYLPQVSDISLPDPQITPSTSHLEQQPSNPLLKDLRLQHLLDSVNTSMVPSLDLSMGSQFGDCSMAVNMASPARERERDLEEELANIEDNKDTWDEAELERIARARATSSQETMAGQQGSFTVGDRSTGRLSSGTVVITSIPTVDLPVFGSPTTVSRQAVEMEEANKDNWDEAELERIARARAISSQEAVVGNGSFTISSHVVEIEEAKCTVVREEEIVTNEVVEEVIEYEYEIVNGVRHLVGESNLGKTVTVTSETLTRTPIKSTKFERITQVVTEVGEELGVEHLEKVEAELCSQDPKMRPRSVDLTEEDLVTRLQVLPPPAVQSLPVFNISVHQEVDLDLMATPLPTTSVHQEADLDMMATPLPTTPERPLAKLPGLKGSPRISNQVSSTVDSFLQTTINETSFRPPSPDDPRRCSTGVKNKENAEDISASGEVCKSLFGQQANPAIPSNETVQLTEHRPNLTEEKPTDTDSTDFVPLSSTGFQLPVIASPSSVSERESRLSTDTYIAAGDSALSTIQEETSSAVDNTRSRTVSHTEVGKVDEVRPVQPAAQAVTDGPRRDVVRTPARPRRSQISYTSQAIEDIAKPVSTPQPGEDEVDRVTSGLMFVQISPGMSEKRKPEVSRAGDPSKRRRGEVSAAPPDPTKRKKPEVTKVASTARPVITVRASKNPQPPKPAAKKSEVKNKSLVSKGATGGSKERVAAAKSAPPKVPKSRAVQPARRLQLARPGGKTGVVHHPNPFAARNTYYDEKWIEKQERGFTRWLNFMLTPQVLEETSSSLPGKVDVAKLWSQCTKDVKVPRAPTREVMSMRAYTAKREMNRLRRMACKLWQSKEVASVVVKVEVEIEKFRLIIRTDRNITKDVGMKQRLLQLILAYNPLWLRVGLETIYGELLPISANSDLLGLSRFLVLRLLSNPDILAEFAHPSVPHSYREGHQAALHRFALKKFLELVFFLDKAKESRVIRHNPCLFCPDSPHKSSREILLSFSKDFLSGEGDITKHLAYMGYTVDHKQTKLDEFDYAVTSIRTDLRCGLRLAKVAELLTGAVLGPNLRVPAVSRLQKVHNTDVALTGCRQGGVQVGQEIGAKDLVDGNREKTLQLLWSLIFGGQLSSMLDLDKLREEIVHLRRSLHVRARMGDSAASSGLQMIQEMATRSPSFLGSVLSGESLDLLMQWSQLVLAHYSLGVENWTTAWCDGRGLCLLVHHYQPSLLAKEEVNHQTSLTHQAEAENLDDSLDFHYGSKKVDSAAYQQFIENEKANFKLLLSKVTELGGVPILISPGDMSNTIPDEKVTATFIGYLAARLLDLSREIKAARTIQLAYRRWSAIKKEERLKVKFQRETS